jgi:hypothetical protein
MLAFAEGLVGWMEERFGPGAISRARVDLFAQDQGPVLCELECVDPNTNLRLLGRRYAQVIAARTAALTAASTSGR